MTRDELINQILDATTPEEITAAEKAADEWMEAHPKDLGIAMACEQLEMMRLASQEVS